MKKKQLAQPPYESTFTPAAIMDIPTQLKVYMYFVFFFKLSVDTPLYRHLFVMENKYQTSILRISGMSGQMISSCTQKLFRGE